MKSHTEYLTFNVPARMDFINITPQIEAIVAKSGVREGLLLCPEGAATLAAYKKELAAGRIAPEESAVLFNCATGLKYDLPPTERHLDRDIGLDDMVAELTRSHS